MIVTSRQKLLMSALLVATLSSGCGWVHWRTSEPARDASSIDSAGADVTFANDQKKARDEAAKAATAEGAQTGPGAGGATTTPIVEPGSDKSSGAGGAAGAKDAKGATVSPMKDPPAEIDAATDKMQNNGADGGGKMANKGSSTAEKVTLQGDALFQFGKSDEQSMLPGGKQRLDEVADKILAMEKDTIAGITIVGHADRLGTPTGNMKISEKRAATVMNYLVRRGVDAAMLESIGKGDTDPVSDCPGGKPNKALLACLSPNRRVEVIINVK